ncbi:TPA: hypothetical protein H2W01_004084 [Salmonella enterica]|nr:hypothetical protein [Salmonella enterica subsp. enterica serovar Oranienburg]HAK8204463.1 hypothetical protein [Salmonella enterica]
MVTDYLFLGFRTVFGFYLRPFSKSWDEKLNQILVVKDHIVKGVQPCP